MSDHAQRQTALDPRTSFIVQAPAGSGKTELLSARFFHLLLTVQEPEEILAITFTRKAAGEMQRRILSTLRTVASGFALAEHQKDLESVVRKVLDRDHTQGWELFQNPQRLRIQTMDAFAGFLAKQHPVVSHLGGITHLLDDAEVCYLEAAENLLVRMEEEKDPCAKALREIFSFSGGDRPRLVENLAELLEKRDQWLPWVFSLGEAPQAEVLLQKNFDQFVLERVKNITDRGTSEDQKRWEQALDFDTSLASWQRLASSLLTQTGTWRKRLSSKHPAILQCWKHWNDDETVAAELHFLRSLPCPIAWTHWGSLRKILPELVAELWYVFQEHQAVDHLEISLRALQALGEPENPSRTALWMDTRLRHILIDECQDTSPLHAKLIERLCEEWRDHEGKSLFLVGDPMQSIYRFRKADVRFFLDLWEKQRFANLSLHPLKLTRNFRSQAHLVEWFNLTFREVFPNEPNFKIGAVPYSAALPTRPGLIPAIDFLFFETPASEAEGVAQHLQKSLKDYPSASLAVLVRARHHVRPLINAMQQANLKYRLVDVENLAEQQICLDLFYLVKLLVFREDLIAWLSVLRSPWCGLTLADLRKSAVMKPSAPMEPNVMKSSWQRSLRVLRKPLRRW